ncbi:MAG: ATPase domain-containing protein [Candidatus Bathyarchaeia archaeon]
MTDYLPTGVSCLDRILNGGVPLGQLTLIYGAAKTGKTTLLLQAAINTASRFKVLYIDSDGTFNVNRFRQISDAEATVIGQNILIFNPEDFGAQTSIIESLENYVTPSTRMVAVDSMVTLYRVGYDAMRLRFNRELVRQLAYLAGLAFQHNLAVLIASPVRSVFSSDPEEIEPVAKRTMFYWPKTVIRLRSTEQVGVREALVERPLSDRASLGCRLRLTENGFIEDDS